MVTTRRAGAATTANSTEDRFVFADFKLIGALVLVPARGSILGPRHRPLSQQGRRESTDPVQREGYRQVVSPAVPDRVPSEGGRVAYPVE